ncbi:hypothetical protein AC249_AIPGENE16288 [Exaiptasia diaphana]|nr:hypothetical protein AC249_AIPGENE16288 [Exaiptasia diaphana]
MHSAFQDRNALLLIKLNVCCFTKWQLRFEGSQFRSSKASCEMKFGTPLQIALFILGLTCAFQANAQVLQNNYNTQENPFNELYLFALQQNQDTRHI